jgi:hypothetical protein
MATGAYVGLTVLAVVVPPHVFGRGSGQVGWIVGAIMVVAAIVARFLKRRGGDGVK